MVNTKTGQAILQAVGKEAQARAFYQTAALRVRNPLARRRLLALAEDEAQHEATLSRLYWAQTGREPGEVLAVPGEPSFDISTLDMAAVLRLAIGEEESASSSYRRMAEEAADPRVKAFLEYLVDIETGHAESLRHELALLAKSPEWHKMTEAEE
jgi:rubrerythrin